MNNVQSYKTPNLTIINGQVKTTSLAIAELFGKSHAHVLRDIETIKANCSPEFSESNFGFSVYDGLRREEKCIDLTRDGMTMIIMGYTGVEAMRFKEAYIMAFNKMETELHALKYQKPAQQKSLTSTQDIDYIKKKIISVVALKGDKGVSQSRIEQCISAFKAMSETEKTAIYLSLVDDGFLFMSVNDGKNIKGGRHGKRFFIK